MTDIYFNEKTGQIATPMKAISREKAMKEFPMEHKTCGCPDCGECECEKCKDDPLPDLQQTMIRKINEHTDRIKALKDRINSLESQIGSLKKIIADMDDCIKVLENNQQKIIEWIDSQTYPHRILK